MKPASISRPLITATHWGAYHPQLRDDQLIAMQGVQSEADPSAIAEGFLNTCDYPARIKRPSIRESFLARGLDADSSGREPFVEVCGETAEKIVGEALRKIESRYGNRAVYAGAYGWASTGKSHHAPSQLHRFLNCFGGFTSSVNNYSFAAAEVMLPHVIGNFLYLLANTTAWPVISKYTDLFVAFGGLPLKNSQVEFGGHAQHVQKQHLQDTVSNGVKFVSISSIRNDAFESLNALWLPLVPYTDTALMLSLAHKIVKLDLHDQEFLDRCCVGFDRFRSHLVGGGIGYCSTNGAGSPSGTIRFENLPTGTNPIDSFIPVTRVADILLHPSSKFRYNGQTYTGPHIELIYWAGGNPFHHHQDINRLLRGWRKSKCTIVHDSCWTATVRCSDIVLPIATLLERSDICASPRDCHLVRMDQILAPYAESKTDFDIFTALAERLGVHDRFTENHYSDQWLRFLYEKTKANPRSGISQMLEYDNFVESGWFRIPPPQQPTIMLQDFRDDPDRCPLRTPSGKIKLFSETVAALGEPDFPGYAQWLELREWLSGNNAQPDHLHLISNQLAVRLHSQLDHGQFSCAHKVNGREQIRMHSDDARKRGIESGNTVRVFNDRGTFLAAAKLYENMRPGVLQIATGAWFDPAGLAEKRHTCKHSNPNLVTHDRATSNLAQGPAALTCLVQREKYNGDAPSVTAFVPPLLAAESLHFDLSDSFDSQHSTTRQENFYV